MPIMERRDTVLWMRANAEDYTNEDGTVDVEALVIGAACEFGEDNVGGPCEDKSHWVWGVAANVAKSHRG